MKVCSRCKQEKPFEGFSKDRAKKDGLSSRCKVCVKQYREQNKERILERNKQYREQNKESISECNKQYYRTPPGKFSHYKNSAKWRGIEFHLTEEQFESFWQKPCEYCGAEIETIGLDRLDSDGHYTIDNVVSCCWSCNKSKGRKTLEEWKKDLDNRKINC